MGLGETLAGVSLAISLTALVIAAGQLWQALIGTVQGYRRCAPSVIGPWAKLRHRRWNWTEFRFEVEFATPHFVVLPFGGDEWDVAREIYGTVYDLVEPSAPEPRPSGAMKIPKSTVDEKRKQAAGAIVLKSLLLAFPERSDDLEKVGPPSSNQPMSRNELEVTWLALIRELHTTYRAFWPGKLDSSQDRQGYSAAALAIRRWNWDFMPPELMKPLATSTLNTIITLALRLGMQWRRLDIETGIFLADGNGYTLTSTDVRGLGVTFQFNSTGKHDIVRYCAPSQAADKMLFGLIPGCEWLVRRDFPLVTRERKRDFKPLFRAIGIEDEVLVESLSWQNTCEPSDEAIILLSAFLPLKGSPSLYNYFPGWSRNNVISPLHWFEGRVGFVDALEARLEDLQDHKAHEALEMVLEMFIRLRTDLPSDFYDDWGKAAVESHDSRRKTELVQICGDMFQWTTKYFRGQAFKNSPDWTAYHNGRTRYVDLVAGHAIMAQHTIPYTLEQLRALQNAYTDEQREKHRALHRGAAVGMHHQYQIAKAYAGHLNHAEHGVVKHLRSKQFEPHIDHIEAAWWVLMLRGIVWDMSTNGDPVATHRPQYHWVAEFVPSAFYEIRSPVWIS